MKNLSNRVIHRDIILIAIINVKEAIIMKGRKDLGYTIVPCYVTGNPLKISRISHTVTGDELITLTFDHCCSSTQADTHVMFVKRKDIVRALENAEPLG